MFGRLKTEAVLTPTPSIHVDIGSTASPLSTGNTYSEDTNAAEQLVSVQTQLTRESHLLRAG